MTFSRQINSVTIDYTPYISVWMKQPRGIGNWAFYLDRAQESEPKFFYGTLAQACRQAARMARAAGEYHIYLGS